MELQTVLGPIPIDDVKMADAHAHVWINPPKGVAPKARMVLNNPSLIERELKDFRSAGGTTLIDCQPGGCGRDARMLVKLAEGPRSYTLRQPLAFIWNDITLLGTGSGPLLKRTL